MNTQPFISCLLNGIEVGVMLDTGAVISCIDYDFVDATNLWPFVSPPAWGTNLLGITDSPVQNFGTVKIILQFSPFHPFKEECNFYILKNLGQTAIIGNNFLRKNQLNIIYEGTSCLQSSSLNLRIPILSYVTPPPVPSRQYLASYPQIFKVSGISNHHTPMSALRVSTIGQQPTMSVSKPPPKIIDIKYKNEPKQSEIPTEVMLNEINPQSTDPSLSKDVPAVVIPPRETSLLATDASVELILEQSLTVPSSCEHITWVKLSDNVFERFKGKLAMVLPLPEAIKGTIMISKSLVKISSEYIPLKLLNLAKDKQVLEGGKVIGNIISCMESEIHEVNWEEVLSNNEGKLCNHLFSVNTRSDEQLKCVEEELLRNHPWIREIKLGELSLHQRVRVFKILAEFSDCFSKGPYDIGRTDIMQAKIELTTDKPIFKRQYPMAPAKMTELQQEVQKLKDLKVVEPSHADFNSPVILVAKADGSRRLCVDFRALNKFVKVYTHPLPTFLECSQLLTNNTYYSSLDLFGGYHQMSLHPDSRKYTTFTVGNERLAFNVLPFGITSGSALFQQLMNVLLGDLQYKHLITYIDDVLLYAKDFDEHLQRLVNVLSRLKQANLKLKTKKCHLFTKRVAFLGHIITENGIYPSHEKIIAVKDWPAPVNRKQVRQFLGLASFFRRFVPSFAHIAKPLHHLTSINVKFKWGPEEQSAFTQLKNCLINPPVLANPRFDRGFIIYSDASYAGLGGILTQKDDNDDEFVVAYTSRKLKDAEARFSVYEIEMLAIIHAVQEFRCYIHGTTFILVTDACPLTHLLSQKHPTARNWRWILKLQQYSFTIKHRKGVAHGSVDALSRRPDYVENRQLFKNTTVNLLERVEISPVELREWKIKILDQLGITMADVYPCKISYQDANSDSFYELLSNLFCHTTLYAPVFRSLIADFEAQNRKFVELNNLRCPESDLIHIRQVKNGAPATLLEVQSACSLFHVPILYKTPEGMRFMLGEVASKWFPYAPNGTILELKQDEFQNWIWINPDLMPTDPDPRDGLMRRDKKKDKIDFDKEAKIMSLKMDNCELCVINLQPESSLYIPTTPELIACQQNDEYCREWINYLKEGIHPHVTKKDFENLNATVKFSNEGVLVNSYPNPLRPGEPPKEIVLLPLSLFKYALESIHDFLGHVGRDKTLHLIKQRYHRPYLTVLVARYLQTCRMCKNKSGINPIKLLPVQQFPIAQQRASVWSVDILGPFRVSESGNKYIVSCLDHYTRWLECKAIPDQTSVTVAKAIFSLIVSRWGVPSQLHSDRGSNFISEIIHTFYDVMKIRKTQTLPYRPQGNGKLEISNKFIVNAIKSRTSSDQRDWDEQIDYALLAYRSSVHQFLADTPFYCALGYDPPLPTDLLLDRQVQGSYAIGIDPISLGSEVAARLRMARGRFKEAAKKEVKSQLKYANKHRKPAEIKPGDVVLLKKPLTKKGYSRKLYKKFIQAFRVIKQNSPVTFTIQEMNGRKQYLVHGENLVINNEAFREDCDAWYDEAQEIMDAIQSATIQEVTPPVTLPPLDTLEDAEEEIGNNNVSDEEEDENTAVEGAVGFDPLHGMGTDPDCPDVAPKAVSPPVITQNKKFTGKVSRSPPLLPPPGQFEDDDTNYVIQGKKVLAKDLALPPPLLASHVIPPSPPGESNLPSGRTDNTHSPGRHRLRSGTEYLTRVPGAAKR